MTILEDVRAYFQSDSSYEDLINFGPISEEVHRHLVQVYYMITWVVVSSYFGSEVEFYGEFGGSMTIVGFIGFLAWFFCTPRWRERKRFSILMVAAFLYGISFCKIIHVLLRIIDLMLGEKYGIFQKLIDVLPTIHNQRGFVTGFLGATMLFCCLSTEATFFNHRRNIYLDGVDCADFIVWSSSVFTSRPNKWYLFVGLYLLYAYVVAYSQEIDAQIHLGNTYYTHHAAALFVKSPAFIYHVIYTLINRETEFY